MRKFFALVGGVVALLGGSFGTLWWVGYVVNSWCPCQTRQLLLVGLGTVFTLGCLGAVVTCLREDEA